MWVVCLLLSDCFNWRLFKVALCCVDWLLCRILGNRRLIRRRLSSRLAFWVNNCIDGLYLNWLRCNNIFLFHRGLNYISWDTDLFGGRFYCRWWWGFGDKLNLIIATGWVGKHILKVAHNTDFGILPLKFWLFRWFLLCGHRSLFVIWGVLKHEGILVHHLFL